MLNLSTLRVSMLAIAAFLCLSSTAFAQQNLPRIVTARGSQPASSRVVIRQAPPRVVIRQATPQDNVAVRYQQLQRQYPTPNGYNSRIWQDGLLQRAQREVTGSAPRAKTRLVAGVITWFFDTLNR
jgi:hypothetical protein